MELICLFGLLTVLGHDARKDRCKLQSVDVASAVAYNDQTDDLLRFAFIVPAWPD